MALQLSGIRKNLVSSFCFGFSHLNQYIKKEKQDGEISPYAICPSETGKMLEIGAVSLERS